MANSENPVKFFKGTSQQYNSILPDAFTFYFLTDTHKVFLGQIQLSNEAGYEAFQAQIAGINVMLRQKASIIVKTTAEWRSNLQISQTNTFYVYSDRTIQNGIVYPGVKIGDGTSYIVDLPFIDDIFYSHIRNSNIHVTLQEKEFWNNKVRTQDSNIQNENLIFTVH